jgi:hypothetical protein
VCFAIALALAFLVPCRVRADAAAPADRPHVLLLNSYTPQYRWTEELVRGVRDELGPLLPEENLSIEFMDARRMVDDPAYFDRLRSAYAYKYARLRPDLVISSDDSALTFLLQYRDELFPGVPLVYCGINSRTVEELASVPNATGVLEGLEVEGNLELIVRLHPDVRRIVLLTDRTSLGAGMKRVAEPVVSRYRTAARQVEIWDDFTIDELFDRVGRAEADTVFFLLAIHKDRAGTYYSWSAHTPLLTRRSRAPIYAMFGMVLGTGVTGGEMSDPHQHGRAAAAIAKRVLAGAPAKDIPIAPSAEYRPRFDYAQLKRFHID